MKKTLLYILFFITSIVSQAQVTITPSSFNVTDQITITVSTAAQTCNLVGTSPTKVYMHAGIGDDSNAFGFGVVGNWGQDDSVGLMTNNGNGTWSITLTPSTYFGLNTTQQANATKLGMVFRNANGSQTLKLPPSCGDFIFNVGTFQVNLTSPSNNSATIIAADGNLNITATNTGGNANYNLKANGTSINTATTASYSYNHTNITANTSYELEVTIGASTITRRFSVIVTPTTISEALPGGLKNGINYNTSDFSKATLVLDAPGKDFVYVAGNFNNWNPNSSYAMKKDPTTSKFWLELNGLTSGVNYSYQYWVVDQTPIANSPALVKTADPCSTTVLSSYDDPWIPSATYPGLPTFPTASGQEREVTVLKTGQTPYNWVSTSFTKPNKDKLVIYELLIRDFDADRNFQDVIDRIQYFKNLGINAIELMPVMEFEGNESWGYNTAFHMALDKFYGTPGKFKELVDLCHQNGIAVILDIAFNHAFGRNPMIRMWMNDPDGDGWGGPSSDNPYFNTTARHSYSVGEDFNHSSTYTKNYVKQTINHWITEFKIDGFRWDLTKGFTQACSSGDDACTNAYQQDRVDVLKEYADYSWTLDNDFYVIFEHLGTSAGSYQEEVEWANYQRSGDTKGIMHWRKMTDSYANLLKGNFADITAVAESTDRFIGYAESHDEERIAYKALVESGQTNGNLAMIHKRLSALGAVHLLVPGPKMIWHFGELGYEKSLWTCNNNTVSFSSPDCKLDTKPQPQWTNNWLSDTDRNAVYTNWAKMIQLKKAENLFENGTYAWNLSDTGRPRFTINTSTTQTSELSYAIVLTNFTTATYNVNVTFPFTGTWYNLMDSSTINVPTLTTQISIEPGGFRVIGNQLGTLSNPNHTVQNIALYPNPSQKQFQLNIAAQQVQIISMAGQLIKTFEGTPSDFQFPISDLQNGIYIIKVQDQDNQFSSLKLIKN